MSRKKLPDRRPSVTRKVYAPMDNGAEVKLLVTIGFESKAGDATTPDLSKPREVFCADFKAGTSLHNIVMDSCILLSRLLQHGDDPHVLAYTLSKPPSLLGTIAKAVADMKDDA